MNKFIVTDYHGKTLIPIPNSHYQSFYNVKFAWETIVKAVCLNGQTI